MPPITGFAHVKLSVSDLDASSAWYCRLLGAREVFRAPDEGEQLDACAILEPASRTVIAFTRHRSMEDEAFTPRRRGLDHLSFAVASLENLEQWQAHLDSLGIDHSPIRDYGYAKAITFSDPDGIALELFVQE